MNAWMSQALTARACPNASHELRVTAIGRGGLSVALIALLTRSMTSVAISSIERLASFGSTQSRFETVGAPAPGKPA
ncbi:MAG: hypothetical protein ACREYF_17020 [Gammaproteobacteria bacterium]